MSIRIVIVDDDPFITASLAMILGMNGEDAKDGGQGFEVLAQGNNGEDAVRLYREHQPDVLLTDIQMPGKSGLEAAQEILSEFPQAKVLLLTTFLDDEYIVTALRVGAKGYIMKQDFEGIRPALLAVYRGQTVFGGEIMSKIPGLLGSTASQETSTSSAEPKGEAPLSGEEMMSRWGLTEKEYELLSYIAQGMNNKEIAQTMYFSEGTVRNYISILLDKLQLRDRTQLAVFYLMGGSFPVMEKHSEEK